MSLASSHARPARVLVALLAAGALGLAAGHATATPGPPPPKVLMEAADARSGQLEVAGNGRVVVSGRVTMQGELSRRGVVQVLDRAGDAAVYAAGRPVTLRRGRAIIRRTAGIVFVTGSNVTVTSSDNETRLFVAGTASVRLSGSGIHRINLGALVPWPRSQFRLSGASAPTAGQRVTVRRSSRVSRASDRAATRWSGSPKGRTPARGR